MAKDTAEYLFKRALWMFGAPTRSWTVIRQSLEHVGKMLPETGLSNKATLLATRLTSLMNEEQARPTLSHEAILKLPPEQQFIEQVRRLRMEIVETSSGSVTAVNELIKMGAAAVPALIAAVDDPRPTRVFHCPYGRAGQRILSISSIGELASQALAGISGKTFKGQSVAGVFAPPTPDTSELRQEIEAWWVEYQKRLSP